MPVTDPLKLSEPDSRRFGMRVVRGHTREPNLRQILQAVLGLDADVAILRCPAGTGGLLKGLARSAMPVINADTLVYYEVDLGRWQPQPLRNVGLAMRTAEPRDMAVLRELIAHTFSGYISHYHSNDLFPPGLVLAGYQEWAEGFLAGDGRKLWVAEQSGQIVAFAACAEDTAGQVGEGVLYGVAPGAAGGGIYGDLIRHTQADFLQRGFKTMKVSTQVQNFAVQKVWSREGFHLVEAWDTLHINALLSHGEKVYESKLMFTPDQVRAFAAVSGDNNPVHLDELAAKNAGFPERIAHGVASAAEFSRILGTVVPGPGTILTHIDLAFFKPLIVETEYRLAVRIPGNLRSGPMHVVAQIRDADNALCCLARADVVLRPTASAGHSS